jgi:hypothetical protein
MGTLSYDEQHRRLRVIGKCGEDEARRVCEALRDFARPGRPLIVDLTAVTVVTADVGRALVDAATAAADCRVTLLRKSGSAVDRCLRETPSTPSGVSRPATHRSSAGTGAPRRG